MTHIRTELATWKEAIVSLVVDKRNATHIDLAELVTLPNLRALTVQKQPNDIDLTTISVCDKRIATDNQSLEQSGTGPFSSLQHRHARGCVACGDYM